MIFEQYEVYSDDDNGFYYKVQSGGDSDVELIYMEDNTEGKDEEKDRIGMSIRVARDVVKCLMRAIEDAERRDKEGTL